MRSTPASTARNNFVFGIACQCRGATDAGQRKLPNKVSLVNHYDRMAVKHSQPQIHIESGELAARIALKQTTASRNRRVHLPGLGQAGGDPQRDKSTTNNSQRPLQQKPITTTSCNRSLHSSVFRRGTTTLDKITSSNERHHWNPRQ